MTRWRRKLSQPEYEQWLQNEVGRCKDTLEQRLGIKVNCFAVPYGLYNQHVKDVAKNAGYEAVFTVYGQPITFRSAMDSLGRYLIEGNKPKVFVDAISMIATSSAGGAPVAEFGASIIASKPAGWRDHPQSVAINQRESFRLWRDRSRQCDDASEWVRCCPGILRSENKHRFLSGDEKIA